MEVENVGENPSGVSVNKPIDKKKWVILFSIIGALIVGLIVAIIVVVIVRGNNPDSTNEAEQGGMQEYVPKEKSEGQQIYEQVSDIIASKLDDVPADDKDETYIIYKDYIDVMQNEEAKALLELDYYQIVMIYDANKEQGQEVLDNMVRIDGVLKTIDSAVAVANAAAYYDDNILYERYNKIVNEREEAEGVDMEMETSG